MILFAVSVSQARPKAATPTSSLFGDCLSSPTDWSRSDGGDGTVPERLLIMPRRYSAEFRRELGAGICDAPVASTPFSLVGRGSPQFARQAPRVGRNRCGTEP